MCGCHKLLFALKQSLRPYLKEETQEYVWNVHPAMGVPALAVSEPPAGKMQMFLGFLSPASTFLSSSHGRETDGHSADGSPEYAKPALPGFLGASSWHILSAAPSLKEAVVTCTPLYSEPHKATSVFTVPASMLYSLMY